MCVCVARIDQYEKRITSKSAVVPLAFHTILTNGQRKILLTWMSLPPGTFQRFPDDYQQRGKQKKREESVTALIL